MPGGSGNTRRGLAGAVDQAGAPARQATPLRVAAASRRERILDAALELFVANGYEGTTMDDIGAAVAIKGPSLYKHVRSKQQLLVELMSRSIRAIQAAHDEAVGTTDDVVLQLRRAVEAHVRFHARNRLDAFLGSRELHNLVPEHRLEIVRLRKSYERSFRRLVDAGIAAGCFDVRAAKLTTFALLDMGTGVAVWFRDDGDASVDQIAYHYGDLAMRLVGADQATANR